MKVGVSSYSFQRLINSGDMSQLDAIVKAKELGFDAIEFIDLMPHDGSTEGQYAKKLYDASQQAGITIEAYTIGADLLNGSDGNMAKEIDRIKAKLDVAAILGVKKLRHDATWGPKPYCHLDAVLPRLIEGCRAVTEYASTLGIYTMVENHGYYAQDSERVLRLISGVNHKNFGALIDMGNFLCADEDPAVAVGNLAPYAKHVHAKDFHVKSGSLADPGEGWFRSRGGNYLRGAIIGHGDVPVTQCLGILKRGGYNGTVSIEFEGMEDNLEALRIGIDNLKRYIQQA